MRTLLCGLSSALGGMERRLVDEARLLAGAGHEVLVATPRFPGFEDWRRDMERVGGAYVDWQPYKFIERQHFAAPFRWYALSTIPMIRARRIDLAHVAMPWNYHGLSMAYVLRRAGIPFVVSVHTKTSGPPLPAQGQSFVADALQGMLGGYAVSRPALDSFQSFYAGLSDGLATMQVVCNGVDTGRFRPDATARLAMRRKLSIADEDFVIMFCGRLSPLKRPLSALRIFAQLAGSVPSCRLLVVGDGPEGGNMQSEARRLGIERNVIMTGLVSDTVAHYAAGDCYLSTSGTEAYSLTTAEALASGLPAVVPDDDVFTANFGACGAVQRCGLEDEPCWVRALCAVASWDTAARQARARDSRDFAVRNLSADTMNLQLTAFYERVFAGLAR